MVEIVSLEEGFAYDAWANLRWLEAFRAAGIDLGASRRLLLHQGPWPDFPAGPPEVRATAVFIHILWAQRIWAERCGALVQVPEEPVQWIEAMGQAWSRLQSDCAEDQPIAYRNMSGAPFEQPFGVIARHVLFHGAYHRGQIREIFQGIAPDAIPATDFIGLYMERGAGNR